MRCASWIPPALAGMAVMVAAEAGTRAAEIPIGVLSNWSRYNNDGWQALSQRRYGRAEQYFRLAIEEVRPYSKDDRRLLARSYSDLARVFYHQGRYADAEPLSRWALSVREAQPKPNPDALFQNLYTLALIHIA